MAPYRLNATDHLKTGKNTLEIEVVNLWRIQLIKDKKLPKEERYTRHLATISEQVKNHTLPCNWDM
jgi:hypothetical protein